MSKALEEFFSDACICHGLNLQEDPYQLQDFAPPGGFEKP
jgi:hypothetical protein